MDIPRSLTGLLEFTCPLWRDSWPCGWHNPEHLVGPQRVRDQFDDEHCGQRGMGLAWPFHHRNIRLCPMYLVTGYRLEVVEKNTSPPQGTSRLSVESTISNGTSTPTSPTFLSSLIFIKASDTSPQFPQRIHRPRPMSSDPRFFPSTTSDTTRRKLA